VPVAGAADAQATARCAQSLALDQFPADQASRALPSSCLKTEFPRRTTSPPEKFLSAAFSTPTAFFENIMQDSPLSLLNCRAFLCRECNVDTEVAKLPQGFRDASGIRATHFPERMDLRLLHETSATRSLRDPTDATWSTPKRSFDLFED